VPPEPTDFVKDPPTVWECAEDSDKSNKSISNVLIALFHE
jgi:hypothetical protein